MSDDCSVPLLPFGVNVIGYTSANFGLGVTARSFLRLLQDHGIPFATLELISSAHAVGADNTYSNYQVGCADQLPYNINLFIIGINSLPSMMLYPPVGLMKPGRINVGLIWWELPTLSKRFRKSLEMLDIVLAGSDYVESMFLSSLDNVRILKAQHPMSIPDGIKPDRVRFGIPHDTTVFLTSFDPSSDVERKNPFGVVAAFKKAFPYREDVCLIIKVNPGAKKGDQYIDSIMRRINELAQHDARILILSTSLPYLDLMCLYASSDVFVSLHRAEGLGLAPLEAMGLGVPIILTAWSGSRSYSDNCSACLVNYRLVLARPDNPIYNSETVKKSAYWAEPDIDDAADYMLLLNNDPAFRRELGKMGKLRFERYCRDAQDARWIDEVCAISDTYSRLPRMNKCKDEIKAELLKEENSHYLPYHSFLAWRARNWLHKNILWRL